MIQSTAEIIFDTSYLIIVFIIGVLILIKAHDISFKIFGIMALVLVTGDSFHLIPRIYALSTDGTENHTEVLGFGTFIASISMTVFYVLLYHFAIKRYKLTHKLTFWVYFFAIIRIALCLFPQNEWQLESPSLSWAVYRNIPFAILGMIILLLYYKQMKITNDTVFKYMWLAIVLSFGFYIPVALFANSIPTIGVLMIPKTIAYVWMIVMGWKALKKETSLPSN